MKIAEGGHRVRPVAAFTGPGAPVKTGSPGSAEAEALFKEARHRRRRRRLASLAAALVLAAAAAIGIGAIGRRTSLFR
jgi:hypothetical protein